MRDPYSLVCSVRLPGIPALLQVWHRDRNGADGACGWTYPSLTAKQLSAIRQLGAQEARMPHFLRYPFDRYAADVGDREALYRALLLLVARMIDVRIDYVEAATIAAECTARGGFYGHDTTFCWLPGYHSNHPVDRQEDRDRHFQTICWGIARQLLAIKRPWWRHPRWHLHHWRFKSPFIAFICRRWHA
ncbi:hypothetical protein [Pseudomonas sp.]|uniref:hypothetical protein n=1 Tax=Pseudomonas sp. TaxID=306 RepID=UPI003D0A937E